MNKYNIQKGLAFSSIKSDFKNLKLIVSVITSIVFFTVFVLFTFTGKTELVLMIDSEKPSVGQVFWEKEGQQNNEHHVHLFKIKEQKYQTIRIPLPKGTKQISNCTLIPGTESSNNIVIHYISVKKSGFEPIAIDLKKLNKNEGIANFCVANNLRFNTVSNTPMLSFQKDSRKFKIDWIAVIGYLFIASLLSFTIVYSINFFKKVRYNLRTILLVLFLGAIIGLSLSMAIKAGFNASPDEKDHFLAAEFFKTNSITPDKYTNLAIHTYSYLWNYSRVYHKGLDYILAGKFSNIFDMQTDSYKSVRLYGILMLSIFLA